MEESKPCWYAMKVFFNKVFEMEALLGERDIATYVAVGKMQLKGAAHLLARKRMAALAAMGKTDNRYLTQGPVIYQRVPLVSSLLFLQIPASRLKEVEGILRPNTETVLGFIYKTADRKQFAVIPDKQMASFRLVTGQEAGGLEFFADDDITRYKEGGKVRVTEGPFKGAEGYIKRIRRDRRLLVSIDGIIAVATTYIPPQFLEPVPEE